MVPTLLRGLKTPKSMLYSKAASATLRNHLIKAHGATQMPGTQPGSLKVAFHKGHKSSDQMLQKVCLAHCMNPGLTFRTVCDPWFHQAFGVTDLALAHCVCNGQASLHGKPYQPALWK